MLLEATHQVNFIEPETTNIRNLCLAHVFLLVRVCVQSLSHVRLFVTPWTVALQTPLPVGFPRQEYQSGLLFPPPLRNIPSPRIEHMSPALAGRFFTAEPPGKPYRLHFKVLN